MYTEEPLSPYSRTSITEINRHSSLEKSYIDDNLIINKNYLPQRASMMDKYEHTLQAEDSPMSIKSPTNEIVG